MIFFASIPIHNKCIWIGIVNFSLYFNNQFTPLHNSDETFT